MHHADQLECLRATVHANLRVLENASTDEMQETILVRDGSYCGRRFRTRNFHAVWFLEENQLKFYGPDGRVVRVLAEPTEADAAVRGNPLLRFNAARVIPLVRRSHAKRL